MHKLLFVGPNLNTKSVFQLQTITHVIILMNGVDSVEFHCKYPQTTSEVQQSPPEMNSEDQRLFSISEEVY